MIASLVAVCLLCVAPVMIAHDPPLHDYPFHIARMDILAHWRDWPVLHRYYKLNSFILPNVGMDAVVFLLSYIMPVEAAGRVFIALTICLQLSGCVALHRSIHHRYSLWPLVASLFIYNWIFLFGFMNYLFGLGLLLWATAIWVRLSRHSPLVSLPIGTAMAVVLFFCHIVACGLFAVIVAGYELRRAFDAPRREAIAILAKGAVIFVIPIALFFLSQTSEGNHRTSHSLINLLRTPAIFVRALMSGTWALDIITPVVVALGLLVIMLKGRIPLARSMQIPVLLLVLTFVLIPHRLFGGWGADTRIPVMIVFALIASTSPAIERKWGRAVFAAVALLIVYRTAVLCYSWHAYDRVYAGIRHSFQALPNDSILFCASEAPWPSMQNINLRLWQPPLPQVANLAVLQGRGIFVPETWAAVGQQLISPTQPYRAMYRFQDNYSIVVTSAQQLAAVTATIHGLVTKVSAPGYLLLLYPDWRRLPLPGNTRLVASGHDFMLLEVL